MSKETQSNKERVLKEYPNVTYWLEGRKTLGWGNLILTDRRLIFLNRVQLADWQIEKAQELFKQDDFDKTVEFMLKLHKKNYEVPLTSVTCVRTGVASIFPFPKLCLRIQYVTPKGNQVEYGFWFRIPLLKGLIEFELQIVMGWISAIKKAVKDAHKAKEGMVG